MLKYRVLKEIPMRTSHVSVKNQVKEAAKQIKEKSTKRPTKIDILYFDEMFVNKKISGCRPQLIKKARY